MAQISEGFVNGQMVREEVPKGGKPAESDPKEVKAEPKINDKAATEPQKDDGDEGDDEVPLTKAQQAKIDRLIAKKTRELRQAEGLANQLSRGRADAEKRAEELEARIAELESKQAPTREDVEPKREDFETDVAYWEAKIEWKAQQAVKAERERNAQEKAEREQQAAHADYLKRLKTSAKDIPDYDEVLQEVAEAADEPMVPPHITQYIRESDAPAQLLYHFAKNPEELERLNSLSPVKALAEIGRLEAKLEAKALKPPAQEPEKKAEPKTAPERPRAPEPMAPINGGNAPVQKDLRDMNTRETIEYWEKHDAERRSRRQRH